MSTSPVFSGGDRVDGQLPQELVTRLEGKTPQEQQRLIVEYYQKREVSLKEIASQAIARQATQHTPPPPGTQAPPPQRTTVDIQAWQRDPQAAVTALRDGLITKEEFNAA